MRAAAVHAERAAMAAATARHRLSPSSLFAPAEPAQRASLPPALSRPAFAHAAARAAQARSVVVRCAVVRDAFTNLSSNPRLRRLAYLMFDIG